MKGQTASLKILAIFIGLLLLLMLAGLAYGLAKGDFITEINRIAAMPWGLVTFIDIYIGFLLLGVWIFWREACPLRAWLFFIPVLLLGNFFSCLYILYAIAGSGGNIAQFINGKRVVRP